MAIPSAFQKAWKALKHAILLGEERGLRLRIKLGKLFVFQTFPHEKPVCIQSNGTESIPYRIWILYYLIRVMLSQTSVFFSTEAELSHFSYSLEK